MIGTAALMIGALTVLTGQPAAAAPCDPPVANPVACENTKAGSPESEWGVSGSGSASIQGFATDISVDQGQQVAFKIDTTASSYRLDIYRMGFYGGSGARKITTVQPTSVRNQPNCLTQSTTGLVDCGNWTQSASWSVPADAVSGIYFAKLVRTDGTAGASHVFFVVRDDDGGSGMLFQTSDTTWQAYNQYGGNSLYTGSPDGRAYKVSYNRPFSTRDSSAEDWVFNSEYPMVRWLESNGYDVSYTTGVDTDRRGAELLEHDAFLSVGHDEYWSGQQRANVEAARAAGVHLAFFSGNEIFWKTRWENSIDSSGTPFRTLVSYKETHANATIDPTSAWTGTWRDPRFSPPKDGGRPENALSGQSFMVNCCATDMVVGSADGKMRFWRNTRVANLAANATTTIGNNVIGYEWDEDLDNGSRPAGAFRLSQTASSGDVLQDYGSTYAGGPATHSMTMYKAPSGALVFGAGTIQWPWALDGNHDRGSAAPDTAAQQATVNLLADMGQQPATLQAGLSTASASTDTAAPTSAITSPADNATVPVGSPVTVTGTAADSGGRVGGVEVSTDDGTTWHRATGRESWTYSFTPAASGTLKIRSRATDDSANIETPGPGATVTAGSGSTGACPCTIWPGTATPAATDPDTSPVELGVKFRAAKDGLITGIRYYKPSTATGTHVGTLWTGTGTKLASVTFTNETASGWQQAAFASPVPVTAGTTYVASYFAPSRYAVTTGYFGSAPTVNGPLTALQNGTDGGNGVYRYGATAGSFPTSTFNSENYWVDVVYDTGTDTTKPALSSRTPAPDATGVGVGVAPTATFSEAVQQSTIGFELRTPSNTLVPATSGYDSATRTATLTPGSALAASTTYTARVSGATDASGNVMDPVIWTFTTGAADTTKPTVTSRTPAPGATGVSSGTRVSAGFDEAVQQSTIGFELRTPSNTLVPATTGYDSATRTATLTPGSALAASTTYTARVSGATDPSGNVMDPVTWSFTTGASANSCPCTIWPNTATPARTDPDRSAVELGVRFRASSNGYVTGIRFYKPVESTGTHVGSLWSNAGIRLGTVTFTNESASGWQQATFANPVPVTANTTYVASYFTPSRYATTSSYFTTATTRGPLTALQDGTDGANGVYRYTTVAGAFPNQSFKSENYWVDVVFEDTDTTKPTLTSRTPAPNATGVGVGVAPTATFSEAVQQSTIGFELRDPSGNQVPATTGYDPATQTAKLTPGSALAPSTTYTARVSGAADPAGNAMDPVTWTFTTAAADTTKPTVTSRSPASNATDVPLGATVAAVFDEAVQQSSIGFELRDPAVNPVPGATGYDPATRTATFTPSKALTASTTYTARVSGATDPSGNVMDPVTWTFTTGASANNCPCTIWPSTATPAATDADTSSVELGVKFQTSTAGFITGIRYYRPSVATGTHVGSLWTGTGTRLASVTFTGGTASGWQQATFAAPVAVSANTTYVASYFTPSRYVNTSQYFATSPTTRGPLTALQDGTDGGNGLYRYTSTAGAFPDNTFASQNYWVDVVFEETASDAVAPVVTNRAPADGSTGVPVTIRPTATFSEDVAGSSISMELRSSTDQVVTSSTTYDPATRAVTLAPASDLDSSSAYTIRLSGAQDPSGNTMAPVSWSFQTAGPPPPPPDQGPGGPIAVVTSDANPSSSYLTEIVRAEGLNEFTNLKNTALTAASLAPYDVVVLGDVAVTDAQVSALTDWVDAGGNLVAMKPDSRLLGLAGLTAQSGTVSEGYIAVDAATEPGAGITTATMQFHGPAGRYTVNGATTVAAMYTSATAPAGVPAVTLRSVGTNGGQVSVFAYDLARSVIETRQGNPVWAGQDRDGATPNRSDDVFFGGAAASDWVDLDKAAIPQADEQQRLLANLITVMNRDRKPMPRFWYLPGTTKAVVVATGDDHGTLYGSGGTSGRFDTYLAASPSGCSVAQWQCPRFTSYVIPSTFLTNGQAASYVDQGFEVGVHPENGCQNFTSLADLQSVYTSRLSEWKAKYTNVPSPSTNRFHCIVWSDWASQPEAELANGMRLDTNYYYYPGSWVANRPGFLNGSGMPQRFTGTDGPLIDVFQASTSMTDESEQSYPFTPDTLLDRALGPEGYYGAFTANLHTDNATTFEDTQVLSSAQARDVPMITAQQLLSWTDGRNGSSFADITWAGNTMGFTVAVGTGASRLTGMLPTTGPGGTTLSTITRSGSPVTFTTSTVKGQQYAMFAASGGSYQATYQAPAALALSAPTSTSTADAATLTWESDQPGTSTIELGTSPTALTRKQTVADRTEEHRIAVDGLWADTRYYYRVSSTDSAGRQRFWPNRDGSPASFTTAATESTAPVVSGVDALSLPDGTTQVSWTTDEPATSRVLFDRSRGRLQHSRGDDDLVRKHLVVLTGLEAERGYWLQVRSEDASGNVGSSGDPVAFRTVAAGIAVQTAQEFRVGQPSGRLYVGDTGFGELTLRGPGSGSYLSPVIDSGLMVDWRRAVVKSSRPAGTTVAVLVRTGPTPTPDGAWSPWRRAEAPITTSGRYLQYRVDLTAVRSAVPSVSAVGFTHTGRLPRRGQETSPLPH